MSRDSLRESLALRPEQLSRHIDPAALSFETTADVPPLDGTIGQERGVDALAFGVEIDALGYNLFVAGAPGAGRESAVLTHLRQVAPARPTPPDWVYVFNFADPDRPNAIALPTGCADELRQAMANLAQVVQREVPLAFESEDYERRQAAVVAEITQTRAQLFEELEAVASANSFAVQMTETGIATAPLAGDEPMTPEAYAQLTEEARAEIQLHADAVQQQLQVTLRQLRALDKHAAERIAALDREVTLFVVGPAIDDLLEQFAEVAEVVAYLELVREDMLANYALLRAATSEPAQPVSATVGDTPSFVAQAIPHLARYAVNVLTRHLPDSGAPVVVERHPTYYNLMGRMDYHAALGMMVTDFRQIKPGALHRANGGFLMLYAAALLQQPAAWDALKRALLQCEVRVEHMGEQLSAVPAATLRPEPIPLNVKVILIGTTGLLRLLHATDETFGRLFKVKAELAPDMPWDDDVIQQYAGFISRQVQEFNLRHFHRDAVASIIEYGARAVEHQQRLTTRLADIIDLLSEASFWAGKAGHAVVRAEDVERALRERRQRSNLVEERMRELVEDGTIDIDTSGTQVGQVNGIAVLDLGDYSFGQPTRITARVSLGRGTIRSVEHEIEMSGRIHSKGFMILSGYLSGQYAHEAPLAIAATLAFEQSYDEIDGDSASSTELYALLSALSELPLAQSIAVTGAIDQFGRVQAVGGVTRKVEGFYAVCAAQGLTGEQGVIVPATNVQNLTLSDEVVEAVRAGRFHIWAVHSIDQGIELLTGVPAGERDASGEFPLGTVHRRVADRLRTFAIQLRELSSAVGVSGAEIDEVTRPIVHPGEAT